MGVSTRRSLAPKDFTLKWSDGRKLPRNAFSTRLARERDNRMFVVSANGIGVADDDDFGLVIAS